MMEGLVLGRRDRDKPMYRWTQDIEDALGMRCMRQGDWQPVKSFGWLMARMVFHKVLAI